MYLCSECESSTHVLTPLHDRLDLNGNVIVKGRLFLLFITLGYIRASEIKEGMVLQLYKLTPTTHPILIFS